MTNFSTSTREKLQSSIIRLTSIQGGCGQGKLPEDFLQCPSRNRETMIDFTSFEVLSLFNLIIYLLLFQTVQVETHGKGKPYTRVEPLLTTLEWEEFIKKFAVVFNKFS